MEDNGGNLTAGQRLTRIESRLDTIFERLDARITEHKKANDETIAKLAHTLVSDFGKRVSALEQSDTSDTAVKTALEKYQSKQTATFRWGIGIVTSLGIVNLIINASQGTG